MDKIIDRDILIFMVVFLLSFIVLKLLIPVLKKVGAVQFEREEALENHRKKEGTPRGGGIVFLLPVFFLLFIHTPKALFVAISTFAFGAIGLIDDLLTIFKKDSTGLSIKLKLALYSIVTICLFVIFRNILSFETFIFGHKIMMPSFAYFILFFFIFVGSANAFNLTDGVDGLLGAVSIPMLITAMVLSLGIDEITLFSFLLISTILAFLWFNSPKASVFMGDIGANTIGIALASISVIGKFELLFALIAIIPVAEAISDFIQIGYFHATKGKRFFKMAPIHHHFEMLGWSESKIVFRFTIVTVIFCLLAILIR